MNAKQKALKTLKLWVIPHIQGIPVEKAVANLSDEFVRANNRNLRNWNVAYVIEAVAIGNGMKVSD